MMSPRLLLAGLLLTAACPPALAADAEPLGLRPGFPADAAAFSWDGLYLGLTAGYQWNDVDGTYYNPVFVAPSLGLDGDGLVGGAYAGYNAAFGPVVVGLEGDAEATAITARAEDRILNSFFDVDQTWQASIRARLGYALDRVLPYVTAGVAFRQWDVAGGTVIAPLLRIDDSDLVAGWTIGAGLDYAVTDSLIGRIEYRYADYGTASRRIPIPPDYERIEAATQGGRVGIAYKF